MSADAEALMMSALMPGLVSAPPALLQSKLIGFTANESSTAWCGNNVVIGFNDMESLLESSFGAPIGYSVSTNKGASFTDKAFPTLHPRHL
jgi:hypothetical protein